MFIKFFLLVSVLFFDSASGADTLRPLTDDERARVLSIVTNPSPICKGSFAASRRRPALDFQSLGLTWVDNEQVLRFDLTRRLLASLAETAEDVYTNLSKSPLPAFVGFAVHLYGAREFTLLKDFTEARPDAAEVLALFKGLAIFHLGLGDNFFNAVINYGEKFFPWFKTPITYKSIAYIFSTLPYLLADFHSAYAICCQRDLKKIALVEEHLLAAYNFDPETLANAENLADWYKANDDQVKSERFNARAYALRNAGKTSKRHDFFMALQSGDGRLVPVGHTNSMPEEDEVRKAAHARIETDPEFAVVLSRSTLTLFAKNSVEQFVAHPDHVQVLGIEIDLAHTWPTMLEKQEALSRITDRVAAVPMVPEMAKCLGELFANFGAECPIEIKQLQTIVRQTIGQMSAKKQPHYLGCAYMCKIPGLAEEVAFAEAARHGLNVATPTCIQISTESGPSIISVNSLHVSLCEHMRLNANGNPPRNVLQILRANGVTEDSDLYGFWRDIYQETWGRENALRFEAVQKKVLEEHEEFWRERVSPQSSPAKAKTHKTGSRVASGASDSSDDGADVVGLQAGYNAVAAFSEAERRANTPSHAVSAEIRPLLRLCVETGSGGSMSIATLYKTNADKTETELAHFRPHRAHAAVWKSDAEKMMNFLWNLYLIQLEELALD